MEFKKGEEPTETCEIDHSPDPPKPDYPPQIDDLHCGLGSFLWFLRIARSQTGRKGAIKQLDDFLFNLRMRGVKANKFFCWLQTQSLDHTHLIGLMPYPSADFVSDLDTWEPTYWELYRIFIDRHVAYGIEPVVNPLMRKQYCGLPYEKNHQGVKGFDSDEARPYQRELMKKYCEETQAITGQGSFMLKPANEFTHKNKDDFHWNGFWHQDMVENVILNYLPIYKVVIDVSKSEGCQIYLNEPLPCGKPYVEGELHGNPAYNRADPKRSILAETHGVSILENIKGTEKLNFIGGKWKRYLLDEDCGGGENARGFRIGGFRFADAEQTKEMLRYGVGKAHKKDERFIFSIFPPGFNLDLGAYIEDYSVDNLGRPEINFWERLDGAQEVYYEILELG
jgi:hypothetical protein